ncbi:hypothetical protein I2I11_04060 [Pontibacter sp. 172403-2]|uniref:hypothetical protein n=1 Tax=Pontibacter rufus TaxID=2791028 RepID=UPI0018AF7197|nr:hypothetical protein [Pontibacter sp. 172403-2]MBF9252458.1 hypothetical protein [Pontibacter sp. 172403-2]
MESSIKVYHRLTAAQFGVPDAFFKKHIKGKRLPVVGFTGGFYTVQVQGDTYTVHSSDVGANYTSKGGS